MSFSLSMLRSSSLFSLASFASPRCTEVAAAFDYSSPPSDGGFNLGTFAGLYASGSTTYTPGATGSNVIYGSQSMQVYANASAALAHDASQLITVNACLHRATIIY